MKKYPGRVENYTNAFLVTVCGILFVLFWTVASTVGFFWVVILSALLDCCLRIGQAYVAPRDLSEDR